MARKPNITLHGPGSPAFKPAETKAFQRLMVSKRSEHAPRSVAAAHKIVKSAKSEVASARARAESLPKFHPERSKMNSWANRQEKKVAEAEGVLNQARQRQVSAKIAQANESSKARSASLNKKLKRRGSKGGKGGGGPDDQPRVPAGSPEGGQWTEA